MYTRAIKCKSCESIEQRFHEANFYNSFGKYICGNCGAGKGCWIDITLKVIDNRVIWNPLTWFDVKHEEVDRKV